MDIYLIIDLLLIAIYISNFSKRTQIYHYYIFEIDYSQSYLKSQV